MSKVCPDLNAHLDDLQKNHGLNLRNDFAAPCGEYAFAIDGPVPPTPSWKLVFQVNDPARLQQTFEQVVTEVNKQLAKEGKLASNGTRLIPAAAPSTLAGEGARRCRTEYVFVNGYLIACPTRWSRKLCNIMIPAAP
jgi:hypothetical protein